ncbi:MAG: YfgM family protein, partial [Wenzhouxiangella sp.]
EYQAGQVALAGEYYEVVRQDLENDGLDAAEEQFQAMRDAVGDHGYAGLAGLHMASAYVDDGRLGRAEEIYREILDQRRLKSLWPIATLRLVRVLEAQEDHQVALALIDEPAPTGFETAWAEARGDLLFELGRLDEARTAWQEALDGQGEEGMGSFLIQLKLDAAGAPSGETS